MKQVKGHHHISMITKDGVENHAFYTKVLGLRLVKKTVNQDSPTLYHLFYGDLIGSPGTELSFFEIPAVGRTHRGTDAITKIGLFVPSKESLYYWMERLTSFDVAHNGIETYAGRDAVLFEDREGLRFALIAHDGSAYPDVWQAWEDSVVPVEHRIMGMATTEITVQSLKLFVQTMERIFNYTVVSQTEDEAILHAIEGDIHGEIYVKREVGAKERAGRGSIHHLAIRIEDDEELERLDEVIRRAGFQSSGVVDRYYFKSIYFREHNGILIELATDGKGFTVDSSVEQLGKNLDLPPFLEEKRAEIEAALKPIVTE